MENDASQQKQTSNSKILILVAVILVGAGAGFFLANFGLKGASLPGKVDVAPGAQVKGNEAGVEDQKTYRDESEGTLEKGGIEGEGSHHLTREGGPSQNVYLTSSVVDLDDFVGKKVHVWGETNKGQKAGWLMDVGKIKVVQ